MGQANGQMLVATMSRDHQGMTVGIVEPHQRSATGNGSGMPNESSWDARIAKDWLAVTINRRVVGGYGRSNGFAGGRMPALHRPTGERICETVGSTGTTEPREEAFEVAGAIGTFALSQQGEGITAVRAQIP